MATLLALLAASQIDKVLGPQTVALRYLYRIKLGKLEKKKKTERKRSRQNTYQFSKCIFKLTLVLYHLFYAD